MNSKSLDRVYSAIIFDCADTLLHLAPSRETIFRDAASEFGITLPLQDIERAYDIVDFLIKMKSSKIQSQPEKMDFYYSINSALCDVLGIRQSLSSLHPHLLDAFRRRKKWQPFMDAAETLQYLAKRAPLYVLANWDAELKTVLKNVGLDGFFRDAISSAELGSEKPERACFDAFLARTSLNPLTTLYIGNEYIADVVGARSAGLTPILVDCKGKIQAADCLRVSSLGDLKDVLREHLTSLLLHNLF